jgi:hypothetical protein
MDHSVRASLLNSLVQLIAYELGNRDPRRSYTKACLPHLCSAKFAHIKPHQRCHPDLSPVMFTARLNSVPLYVITHMFSRGLFLGSSHPSEAKVHPVLLIASSCGYIPTSTFSFIHKYAARTLVAELALSASTPAGPFPGEPSPCQCSLS